MATPDGGLWIGFTSGGADFLKDGLITSQTCNRHDGKAAAEELVRQLPTQKDKQACLLPPIADARKIGRSIAEAVGKQAIQDGQAQVADENALRLELEANIWEPLYVPYELK